jgi:hypothetical protein
MLARVTNLSGLSRKVDELVRVVEDDLLRRHLALGLLGAAEVFSEHDAHLGLAQAVHLPGSRRLHEKEALQILGANLDTAPGGRFRPRRARKSLALVTGPPISAIETRRLDGYG